MVTVQTPDSVVTETYLILHNSSSRLLLRWLGGWGTEIKLTQLLLLELWLALTELSIFHNPFTDKDYIGPSPRYLSCLPLTCSVTNHSGLYLSQSPIHTACLLCTIKIISNSYYLSSCCCISCPPQNVTLKQSP